MVKAVAILKGDSNVSGTIYFEQDGPDAPTKITGTVTGNDANADRGFHIHQFGDNTNGCTSAGPHFNPFGSDHGAPTNPKEKRHVGDLGNVKTDAKGVATLDLTDKFISLIGENSVIGRSVVVHAGVDDLGVGGHAESLKTGNAGGRNACGVIGIAN